MLGMILIVLLVLLWLGSLLNWPPSKATGRLVLALVLLMIQLGLRRI